MKVFEIYKDTYCIDDNYIVKAFLINGENKSILIDTCMTIQNIKSELAKYTDKPIELLQTHCDRDHIGANGEFEFAYIHEKEMENAIENGFINKPIYIKENDVIDLGNRKLKIIEIKGHTEGSIGVIDIENRVLFCGDPIQDGNIFMFGKHRNFNTYIQGLENVKKHLGEFDVIYPSHGSLNVDMKIVDELITGAKKIINKELKGEEFNAVGMKVLRVDVGCAGFLCDYDK